MKRNVLFVSLAFPPKSCPESLQTAKYFKYLHGEVGEMQVVTASCPSLFMPYDDSLKSYLPESLPLTELKVFESKYINYGIRKISPALMELPDYKVLYSFKTNKILKSLKIKPDVIYSRSFPLTSAFIAYKLHKKLNLPWVFHLSDPWTISPIESRTSYAQRYNEKKETEFFKAASYISFTSEETIKLYSEKYPEFAEKYKFFPNVFDPDDITEQSNQKSPDEIVFSYTGGLANTRTCEPVLKALKELHNQNPELFKKVKFIFAGQFDRRNKGLFEKYDLPFVENRGLLTYNVARGLMYRSDILLLIDTWFEDDSQAMFLPSKLLDYAITGKKIIAVTNKNSTTYNFVNNRFGDCFEHNDIEGLKKQIAGTIESIKNKGFSKVNEPDFEFLKKYSADINAKALAGLLNSL